MPKINLFNFLLYCALSKEEYNLIKETVWKRNTGILSITSLLSAGMGLAFLIFNWVSNSDVQMPYLFLFVGSLTVFTLRAFFSRTTVGDRVGTILCYVQMLLVCVYAGILSTQPSNFDFPATSIIVFIALLPLTIDDRPIRMYGFMLGESASYLVVSRFLKSAKAFSLDLINVLTFCVIGMILYSVICVRNIREIYQGFRVQKIQQGIISSLATVVEERDENTGGHIFRTENYVSALIKKMKTDEKYSHLPDSYYKNVMLAASMHDIGKIKIPDSVLNKPGRLTPEEYEIMKRHAGYGEEIIQKTMKDVEEEDYFIIACNIAKYHHERYDGKGYPDGLDGEDIPLEARIMALADVYDALVSERVYKKPIPAPEAKEIIREGIGTQFDPHLAKLFVECIGR